MANWTAQKPVSLTSQWFIRKGSEAAAFAALDELAAAVCAGEADTLSYLVHAPYTGLQSLPPTDPSSVLFFEVYRDAKAFEKHVNGPIFTGFVAKYGDLFVWANGKPFTFVSFLTRRAGFIRQTNADTTPPLNHHPCVMFEIMAKNQPKLQEFYQSAFHWSYSMGKEGFAYVRFPLQTTALLGGIGQAVPGEPGLDPGHNFYLLVDDIPAAIDRVVRLGGSVYMEPTAADGYDFAMVRDPEGNPVGLITTYSAGSAF